MDGVERNIRFQYHPPREGSDDADRHAEVRATCAVAARRLDELCGEDSREKSLAITHLEEAMFWANAAIARNKS